MFQQLRTAGLSFAIALAPAVAAAHAGHGQTGDPHGWRHYLAEPQHALLVGGALVAAAVALYLIRTLLCTKSSSSPDAPRRED